MSPRPALLVLLATLVWGCASAEGAYRDGMDREVAGDYGAAAEAYVRALERDRGLANVPGRLRVAGREAVRRWTGGAADPVAAADGWLAADALVRRAGWVGVDLDRPATFEADRDGALDAAVADLLRRADDAGHELDWAAALGHLDRARVYRPSPARRAALDAAARDAHLGWARADADTGRYRSAYGRVESALALTADSDPALDAVLDLQDRIVAEGTVLVAALPAEAVGRLPRGFAREIDDATAAAQDVSLPPLVAVLYPDDARRDVRRGRGGARTPRLAAEAARCLGADLALTTEVGPLLETRTQGEAREGQARLRDGGGGAVYDWWTVTLALEADVAFDVVDAASGRVVCSGEAERRVTGTYEAAAYDGDWTALDLSRAERDRFREDADDVAFEDALARLRDALAGALADRAAGCLAAQVP